MRRLIAPLAGLFLALFLGGEVVLAQGQGPPDPVRHVLHDRSMAPGPPTGFHPGPPGRGATPPGFSREDAAALQEILPEASFHGDDDLARAVAAFNAWVLHAPLDRLQAERPRILEARALLAQRIRETGAPEQRLAAEWPAANGEASSSEDRPDREALLLATPSQVDAAIGGSRPWAAGSIATPTGYGIDFGDVWVGASAQARARRSDGATGAAGMGFGLGNAQRLVGMQVSVYSFGTLNSGFWNRGGVDVHVHRQLPKGFAVAAGWESAVHWGGAERDSGSSRYAVATQWIPLGSRDEPRDGRWFTDASLSVGVGDGRFQPEEDFVSGKNGLGLFGSAALRVASPVTVLAEWTGQDLTLATTLSPFRPYGVDLTAAVTDLTGNAGDGARFGLMGSYGVDFRR